MRFLLQQAHRVSASGGTTAFPEGTARPAPRPAGQSRCAPARPCAEKGSFPPLPTKQLYCNFSSNGDAEESSSWGVVLKRQALDGSDGAQVTRQEGTSPPRISLAIPGCTHWRCIALKLCGLEATKTLKLFCICPNSSSYELLAQFLCHQQKISNSDFLGTSNALWEHWTGSGQAPRPVQSL